MSKTHLDPSQTAHERRAQIAWLLFKSRKATKMMEVDHGRGKSRSEGRMFVQGQRKAQRKKEGQGQGQRETPRPMSSVSRSPLGPRLSFTSWWQRQACCFVLARDPRVLSLFRQAYLGMRPGMTGSQVHGAFTVSVPLMLSFASFDFDGKFILDSGATMSMERC